MNTIAIIPARGGSKGIPKKNIRPLKGYPLVAYSIAAAILSKRTERVVVSTDSEEIAEIAGYYGAEVPFLRPARYAADDSTDRPVILHALRWFQEHEGQVPEYWVELRPTTPLRDPAIIDAAIAKIVQHPEATSLRSGHPAPESPFKWFEKDENGYFQPLRPENPSLVPPMNIPEYYNLPRQCFATVYISDGYVEVIKASIALSSEMLFGEKVTGFVTPVCYEVDTLEELELIEYQIEKKGSPLLDYLRSRHPLQRQGL